MVDSLAKEVEKEKMKVVFDSVPKNCRLNTNFWCCLFVISVEIYLHIFFSLSCENNSYIHRKEQI